MVGIQKQEESVAKFAATSPKTDNRGQTSISRQAGPYQQSGTDLHLFCSILAFARSGMAVPSAHYHECFSPNPTESAMSRRSRLVFPDVPLHIIQRGNNRQACFSCTNDFVIYLHMLEQHAMQSACRIHAYVLMTNHVHLLLSPQDRSSASRLMKGLGQQYVQYFNRRHRRSGTLWEGRFRSCLVQDEQYFLVCQRYVELNPVRAAIVAAPGDYPWSSFQSNAFGRTGKVVSPHETYSRLGSTKAERNKNYRALFAEILPVEMVNRLRRASNGNFAFGDASFEQEMEEVAGRAVSPRLPGRRSGTAIQEY
jgi:putative transposase